jgi:hypothetical protein
MGFLSFQTPLDAFEQSFRMPFQVHYQLRLSIMVKKVSKNRSSVLAKAERNARKEPVQCGS